MNKGTLLFLWSLNKVRELKLLYRHFHRRQSMVNTMKETQFLATGIRITCADIWERAYSGTWFQMNLDGGFVYFILFLSTRNWTLVSHIQGRPLPLNCVPSTLDWFCIDRTSFLKHWTQEKEDLFGGQASTVFTKKGAAPQDFLFRSNHLMWGTRSLENSRKEHL